MTDSKDSADLEGTQESANSEGSNNNSGQQSSSAGVITAEQFTKLASQVEQLTRSLQSDKDRAVKKTNQRLDGLEGEVKSILQTALKQGRVNVSDLLSDIEDAEEQESRSAIAEMARAFKSGQLPEVLGLGSPKKQGVDTAVIVKELGLDESDLRVKEFRSRAFESEAQAALEGAKLLKTIVSTQPSDADRPSDVAGSIKSGTQQERLMEEYKAGSAKLYGRELINYKMEMRKKGLNIQ